LAIYIKCKEWNCLPNSGGLFDQDPDLLDAFDIISYEVSKAEKQEQQRKERESRSQIRRR
jgi:hypothetical protein